MSTLRPSLSRKRFTLIELLVAMFILSMLLVLVMWILNMTQKLTRRSAATSQISENERVALDVIERDLRSALTSSMPGREIGFYIGNPLPNPDHGAGETLDSLQFCLVSSTDPPDAAAKSRLAEITYRFHVDRTANTSTAPPPFTLVRQVVTDATPGGYWNFRGRPNNWWLNDGGSPAPPKFETVTRGVADFSIKCFDANDEEIPPGTDTMQMPLRIEVTIVIFDERLLYASESERFETQHSTTRIIRLGELQSN